LNARTLVVVRSQKWQVTDLKPLIFHLFDQQLRHRTTLHGNQQKSIRTPDNSHWWKLG